VESIVLKYKVYGPILLFTLDNTGILNVQQILCTQRSAYRYKINYH